MCCLYKNQHNMFNQILLQPFLTEKETQYIPVFKNPYEKNEDYKHKLLVHGDLKNSLTQTYHNISVPAKQVNKETAIQNRGSNDTATEKMTTLDQIYLGSLTVIGLFMVFRALYKN